MRDALKKPKKRLGYHKCLGSEVTPWISSQSKKPLLPTPYADMNCTSATRLPAATSSSPPASPNTGGRQLRQETSAVAESLVIAGVSGAGCSATSSVSAASAPFRPSPDDDAGTAIVVVASAAVDSLVRQESS